MKIERLINFFRLVFVCAIVISDLVMLTVSGISDQNLYFMDIAVLGFIFIGFYAINKQAVSGKYYYFLKYRTVTIDIGITFGAGLMTLYGEMPVDISTTEIVTMTSIFLIFFNSLSILRGNKTVVIYSTLLSIVLNTVLFILAEATGLAFVYTSIFILISGAFNLWVSGYIIHSIIYNEELLIAKNEIQLANTELRQQKEEIESQRDEIEAQRDEIAAQRDLVTSQKEHIEEQKKEITDSINYAFRIQSAMLPPPELINKILPENFVFYKPKDVVSGDFFYFEEADDKIFVAAVDCTGHGVPGAIMSVIGYNALDQAIKHEKIYKPSGILSFLSHEVAKTLRQSGEAGGVKDGMDITLCVVDKKTGKVEFSGAYNPLVIIFNNSLVEIKADKIPIGISYPGENNKYTNHELKPEKGSMLYLFSDGYADQFGGKEGKKLKYKAFYELLIRVSQLPVSEQLSHIDHHFTEWKGNLEQIDDVMVIGIRTQ